MELGSVFKRHSKLAMKGFVIEVCMASFDIEDKVSYKGYVSNRNGEVLTTVSSEDTYYNALTVALDTMEKYLNTYAGDISRLEDHLVGLKEEKIEEVT